jgi:hypothetical protein
MIREQAHLVGSAEGWRSDGTTSLLFSRQAALAATDKTAVESPVR